MKRFMVRPALSFLSSFSYMIWLASWIFLGVMFFLVFIWALNATGLVSLKQSLGSSSGLSSFSVEDFSKTITLIGLLVGMGFLLVVLIVAGCLRRLCASLKLGDPFIPQNAQRLRIIWITLMVFEITRYLLYAGVNWAVKHGFLSAHVADLRIAFSPWIAIVALMVLAEVFKEGTRLRQEQKWTI